MVCLKNPILYLLLMPGTISCNAHKDEEHKVVEVTVVTVGKKTIPKYTEYVGEVYGKEDIGIHSRVKGWVTGLYFKEGDIVRKGQLLYTINDLPLRNNYDQAIAKLAQVKAKKIKDKAELDRVEPLAAMHALSLRELDQAKATYEASKSEVEAAEAIVRNAKIEVSYAKITAPITGIIGISKVYVGDYIGDHDSGFPLNVVSSTNIVYVRFPINEDDYLKFAKERTGSDHRILSTSVPVELILSDGTVYSQKGIIDLTNRHIDPTTGSLLIQASFSNPNKILRPGQYVKVRMQTAIYKDAVLVPHQAVNQIQNVYQVFIVDAHKKITPVTIKPGIKIGSSWIVDQGLKPGDKVALINNGAVTKSEVPVKFNIIHWNYDSTPKY
ncbi:MAG TPA: efflux RND transporter periplasmic adaptor subunit [Sediminibacterium sp.]|nr:efflux RND transporter periplasmic adaptor subunit [Sediminibacterium sp.]